MTKKIAIIGAGYWGKNLIRTFNNLGALGAVFDLDDDLLDLYRNDPVYTGVEFGTDYTACLDRWDIYGIVVATPPASHFVIAETCLNKGKHLFVEKPMTLDSETSKKLVDLAKEKKLVLMTGHIFLYSPEILKLKEVVNTEDFGDIRYAYTQRLNLGKIQDSGVIMDLAPHDISILDYVFDDTCDEVKVTGGCHVIDDIEDVAFVTMRYKKGMIAHLHLSWLDPLKVRNTVVVGTKQMALCNSGDKTLNIYNTSVDVGLRKHESNVSYGDHLLSYKYGDVISPYIPNGEPMKNEAEEFLACIDSGTAPLADGNLGLSVVKTMTAMKKAFISGEGWEKV